jgi:serine/threonine-protein phosphatase 5
MMENFKDQKPLHKRYTLQIIEKCRDILMSYETLVDYPIKDDEEITICGDIHGQYYDLFNIFKLNGHPAINNKYLFNGDFVDRGSFSVECMLTLIAWKAANRDFLHMTRGNHEAKQVNTIYGFKGEVEAKYKDPGVYEAFSELFCALPLSYVFNNKVMVCHGGLPSEDSVNVKEIKKIYRFVEPPEKGAMCDLLWADPSPLKGRTPSKRGASMGFGPDITSRFLEANDLSTSTSIQIF